MLRLRQQIVNLLGRLGGEILQKQRQEVWQLTSTDVEALPLVHQGEIDHCLTTVSALAMHMLEQMQRQSPGAIEEEHVALLCIVDIAT